MSLFEDICSYNNLLLAFDRVEENAGTHGVDNITIEDFSVNLQNKIFDLRKDLLNGTYYPSALRKAGIPKPNGKIRWLAIPIVKDRIIQTSAAMKLSPITDDKRRAKIAVQLHNFGQRVQRSVFECYLNKEQLDELKIRLEKIMDFAEDSIRYYYLCKKDEKNIEFIGENIIYKNEDYFMIWLRVINKLPKKTLTIEY